MGTYRVVTPCAWLNGDGGASVHRKPGAVVDIPDETAAELGDAVTPINTGKADSKPKQRPREPKTKPKPKPAEQPVEVPGVPVPEVAPGTVEPAAPNASPNEATSVE